jgi:hypothetical protein
MVIYETHSFIKTKGSAGIAQEIKSTKCINNIALSKQTRLIFHNFHNKSIALKLII